MRQGSQLQLPAFKDVTGNPSAANVVMLVFVATMLRLQTYSRQWPSRFQASRTDSVRSPISMSLAVMIRGSLDTGVSRSIPALKTPPGISFHGRGITASATMGASAKASRTFAWSYSLRARCRLDYSRPGLLQLL